MFYPVKPDRVSSALPDRLDSRNRRPVPRQCAQSETQIFAPRDLPRQLCPDWSIIAQKMTDLVGIWHGHNLKPIGTRQILDRNPMGRRCIRFSRVLDARIDNVFEILAPAHESSGRLVVDAQLATPVLQPNMGYKKNLILIHKRIPKILRRRTFPDPVARSDARLAYPTSDLGSSASRLDLIQATLRPRMIRQ